jgi:hypothetical protein
MDVKTALVKVSEFSEMIPHFYLMIICTTYKIFDENQPTYPNANALVYCYDNTFADLKLNSGLYPSGIWGAMDMYTWEGFGGTYLIDYAIFAAEEVIWNSLVGFIFAMVYAGVSNETPFCNSGEKQLELLLFGAINYDICNLLNW